MLSIPNISGQNKPLISLLFCALRHSMSSASLLCPSFIQGPPQEGQTVCSPTFSSGHSGTRNIFCRLFLSYHSTRFAARRTGSMLSDLFLPPAIPVQGTFFTASFCPITPQDSPQEEQTVCFPVFSSSHSGARNIFYRLFLSYHSTRFATRRTDSMLSDLFLPPAIPVQKRCAQKKLCIAKA